MKKQTRTTKKRQSEVAVSEISSWLSKSRKLENETSKIFEGDEDTTHHTDDHHLAGVKVLLHGLDNVAEEGATVVEAISLGLGINALEFEAISLGLGVGDLGSRKDVVKRQAIKVEQERLEEAEMRNNAYKYAYAKADDEASKLLADEVKKKEEGGVSGPQAIALLVASNRNNNETVVDDQNPEVVFTEMGEFVWGLHIDEEARKLEHEDGWTQVAKETIEEEEPNSEEDKEIVPDEIIHEVVVGKGLSGALKLVKDRGTLKEESIDEWSGDRNMDKKEIHIERTDEFGRILTRKEAFRLFSHKFHGKGPGKMKQEKRIKQYYDELKMKQSSGTPSLSVERMRETQSRLKTPYLVLS